jgi:hypothetical protein
MTEHRKFQKIPRLFRDIIITEKIDGTNGLICINHDMSMQVGSRNRWLSAETDNMNFYKWAMEHKEELQMLGPGMHYGEWWGQGIQRRYGLDHKRFSLFNVSRWTDSYEEGKVQVPPCCHVVPILYNGPLINVFLIEQALNDLLDNGSKAAPGFRDPEGVVLMHKPSGHLYKYTFDGDGVYANEKKKKNRKEAVYDECCV